MDGDDRPPPTGPVAAPAARAELLQRQLMELECLAAMYPREGDHQRVEVLSAAAARDAGELVEAWEATGEAPGLDVLNALAPLSVALTVPVQRETADEASDGGKHLHHPTSGTITMWATLPAEYPTAAPTLKLSATHLPRDAVRDISDKVEALAEQRTAALASDGAECLAELAQEMSDAAAAAAAAAARVDAEAPDADEADEADGACHAVVRIDHMNDSSGYVKRLQKWATQLGLAARLFYAAQKDGKDGKGASAARCGKGPPRGGRVEGVYVVLGGDGEAVQGFLTRLRTEVVDVDGKGNKCRERQSTVMCRRAASQVKPGQDPVPAFEGFECEAYEGGDALEERLAAFNLLHVGAGTQRFQPT